jgi:hypothetical protein
VRLALLAHHERIEPAPCCGRCVQHRGRDRVRTQRQSPYRVVLQVARGGEHDPAHQRCGVGVESHAAEVDVVVGLTPRREHDPAVHDRLVEDLETQGRTVVGDDI